MPYLNWRKRCCCCLLHFNLGILAKVLVFLYDEILLFHKNGVKIKIQWLIWHIKYKLWCTTQFLVYFSNRAGQTYEMEFLWTFLAEAEKFNKAWFRSFVTYQLVIRLGLLLCHFAVKPHNFWFGVLNTQVACCKVGGETHLSTGRCFISSYDKYLAIWANYY